MSSSQSTEQPFDEQGARRQWAEEAQKLGRFNLVVLGKTGVGKSTLINTIFGESVARTGIGQPVTGAGNLYVTRAGNLGLYDTRGFELGSSSEQILADLRTLVESKRTTDAGEHIHAAYYCVRAGDHRLEPAEPGFIRGLHDLGIPVFLVLTQVHSKGGQLRPEHVQFAQYIYEQNLPIYLGRPFLTAALPDVALGFEAHGVTELVDATYQAAPEAAKMALAAAQVVDRDLKLKAARVRIKMAAGLAASVGAAPIPFSDAALIVPIQTGMMASISQIYGVPMDASLAAGLAASTAATNMGRSLAASSLKLIPGAGSVVGSAVSASVSSSFTYAMGEAWARVCSLMLDGKFGPLERLDNGKVRSVFLDEFKGLFSSSLDTLKRKGGGGV